MRDFVPLARLCDALCGALCGIKRRQCASASIFAPRVCARNVRFTRVRKTRTLAYTRRRRTHRTGALARFHDARGPAQKRRPPHWRAYARVRGFFLSFSSKKRGWK